MKAFFYVATLAINSFIFCSISLNTPIKTIGHDCLIHKVNQTDVILTFDETSHKICLGKIIHKKVNKVKDCIVIVFDNENIIASLDQKFYLPYSHTWQDAQKLSLNDWFLTLTGQLIQARDIYFVEELLDMIEIEVEATHTFFVGKNGILVHNTPALAAVFVAEAAPIIVEAAISLGTTLATWYAAKFVHNVLDPEREKKQNIFENEKNDDAQAPGMPTADDGYKPPKKWDGKKVPNPCGPGFGWPDNKGRVWVPTGPNGHGGPHWDVEYPNGIDYDNVFPGGRIKKGKGRR